jgi:hypothetical protein
MSRAGDPVVRLHNHACISIDNGRDILLVDPWFSGEVFDRCWTLRAATDTTELDLARVRHVWISHEHPDHLHFPTLATLRHQLRGDVTLWYVRQRGRVVRDAVERLGYRYAELQPNTPTALARDLLGTAYPTRYDCALVVQTGGRTLLVQNDCALDGGQTRALRRAHTAIDAWFFQFSLAGWYGNPDDPRALGAARRRHFELLRAYHRAFKPVTYVPFASFSAFCREANAWMNAWAITVDDLRTQLPELPMQVLFNGDALRFDHARTHRSEEAIARWREVFERPVLAIPHAAVDDAHLLAAGRALMSQAVDGAPAVLRPPSFQVGLREGRAIELDYRHGRVDLVERPDPRRVIGEAPAEQILFYLAWPFGADTLNIGACARVFDRWQWRRMIHFRIALYKLGGDASARDRFAALSAESLRAFVGPLRRYSSS